MNKNLDKYRLYRIINQAKGQPYLPVYRDMNLGPNSTIQKPMIQHNSAFISSATVQSALSLDTRYFNNGLSSLVLCLLSLDALLFTLFTYDNVYSVEDNDRRYVIDQIEYLPHKSVPAFVQTQQIPEFLTFAILSLDPIFNEIHRKEIREYKDQFFNTDPSNIDYDGFMAYRAAHCVVSLETSIALEAPFVANQTETAMCVFDTIQTLSEVTNSPQRWAIDQMKKVWRDKATRANEIKGKNFFTINMPFFFVYVARECDSIDSFWSTACQMREEKEATAFRRWISQITKETDLVKIEKQRKEIDDLADKLEKRLSGKRRVFDLAKQVSISIGFPPSVSISFPASLLNLSPRKHHIRFLNRLVDASTDNGRLQSEIVRIFNKSNQEANQVVKTIESLL